MFQEGNVWHETQDVEAMVRGKHTAALEVHKQVRTTSQQANHTPFTYAVTYKEYTHACKEHDPNAAIRVVRAGTGADILLRVGNV